MVPDWMQWTDVVLSVIAFGLAVMALRQHSKCGGANHLLK